MKFDYNAYERLFPRAEAEKIKAERLKEQEQKPGNVLEEAEKPQAKQDPVKEEKTVPSEDNEEGGVIDEE